MRCNCHLWFHTVTDELTLVHSLREESFRIQCDISSMLAALPPNHPNHYDAIVLYLSILGHWSIPDIIRHADEIIQIRSAK